MLASFLTGFGFQAYVVCGRADAATAKMDRSAEACALLETGGEKAEEGGAKPRTKYVVREPPRLESKYLAFLDTLKERILELNSKSELKYIYIRQH